MIHFPQNIPGEKHLGTVFLDSNIKNLNNEHLKDPVKEKKFKNDSAVVAKLDFSKYDLFGFIRNDKSWHSVEPFDLGNGYIRKSININFYF